MMNRMKRIKSSLFVAATLILFLAWIVPPAWCEDKWPPIRTTTGFITGIGSQSVVLLDGILEFYPSFDALRAYPFERPGIPEWVTLDTKASLSYYETAGKRFYLDIVRPGEPFSIKEGVERARQMRSPQ